MLVVGAMMKVSVFSSIKYANLLMNNLDLDQQTPCELQFVGVPLVSKEVCKNTELGLTYRDAIGRDLPDVQLCAGHMEGGRDACQVSFKNQKSKIIF